MMPVLAHERVVADAGEPERWLYVLHGIFGAGRNWASVIRRAVRERPDWGALLVDLREHGASRGFAPPHTIDAAAVDLARLAEHVGIRPDAVLGHSFGGKVALRFAAGATPPDAGGAALLESARSRLRQVWVVDSTPAAREPDGSAWTMLNLIRQLPATFTGRDALIDELAGHGIARPVAQWMATNLEAGEDGTYRWRFDLDAIEALLRSFFDTDAWSSVEAPAADVEVHIIRAIDSSVLSGPALDRARAAAANGRTHVHEVAGGHWVNAENPAAVRELLVRLLPRA